MPSRPQAPLFCAVDFGTSNSTVGIWQNGQARLLSPEPGKQAVPTALFFPFDHSPLLAGNAAIEAYMAGEEGRFMRGIKGVLGTTLFNESTLIKNRRATFADIIGSYLNWLKTCAEDALGQPVTSVTLGRPVHFLTAEPEADTIATAQLTQAAHAVGFKQVNFLYEPLAAAYHFETTLTADKLALIIDIGGGTADFSVIRLGPKHIGKADRQDDILANHGLRLGGAMIDRAVSLDHVMPLLGYKSKIQGPQHEQPIDVPAWYYHYLTTWHRINALYEAKVTREIRDVRHEALEADKIDLLLELLNMRGGHRLALDVEKLKINLGTQPSTVCDLTWLASGLTAPLTQPQLAASLEDWLAQLQSHIQHTLTTAQLRADQIDTVFVTGGPSAMPLTRQAIAQALPHSTPVFGDLLTSVGTGLTLAAARTSPA